jgi:hypothetical protein
MTTWRQKLSRTLQTWVTTRTRRPHRKAKKRSLLVESLEDRTVLSLASLPNQLLPTVVQPIDVQFGRIDSDSLTDVAVLGANGTLTTALNDGANAWRNVQTQNLGTGPANGMVLGGFDSANPFVDLAV